MTKQKETIFVTIIGWCATGCGLLMYFSYIDQIGLNIEGKTGSLLIPIATTINCTLWVTYGLFKAKRDWPIIVCNVPGFFLAIITIYTALKYQVL